MNCWNAVALAVYTFSTSFFFKGASNFNPAWMAFFAKLIGFAVELTSQCTLLVVLVTRFDAQDPFLAINQQVLLILFSNTVSTNW